MGTDIEFHVEKRTRTGWVRVPEIEYDDRNYDVFAALCGVRLGQVVGHGNPVVPMGKPQYELPSDVDPYVAHLNELDGYDAHSTTYRTLAELNAYDWEKIGEGGFRKVLARMAEHGSPEDVRAVFWFSC